MNCNAADAGDVQIQLSPMMIELFRNLFLMKRRFFGMYIFVLFLKLLDERRRRGGRGDCISAACPLHLVDVHHLVAFFLDLVGGPSNLFSLSLCPQRNPERAGIVGIAGVAATRHPSSPASRRFAPPHLSLNCSIQFQSPPNGLCSFASCSFSAIFNSGGCWLLIGPGAAGYGGRNLQLSDILITISVAFFYKFDVNYFINSIYQSL